MAERLKRYRPLGVTVPTVPTVDYVATGRAQSRAYGAIASGLDRMTDFALKRFEEKALIEGAEYGAQNAPTLKQLQDAQGDIEDVVPGDQTTVFGRAARKAALASMNVNFEVAAREDLLNLQMQAQLEDMDTATFTEKSNAIIDGYTSTLQDVSPSTALKFRATMATAGNSALLAHAKEQINKQQEAEQFAITSAMDIYVNGDATRGIQSRIQTILSEGSTTTYDEFGDMHHVSVNQKIDAARNTLKEMAFSVTDITAAEKYLKLFDDNLATAINTEISNFVLESPTKNLRALRTGEISDRKIQDLFTNTLDATQRKAAIKSAHDAITEQLSTEASLEAARERQLKIDARAAYVDWVDAFEAGDEKKQKEALDVLRYANPEKYEEFLKRTKTGDINDDAETMIFLQRQKANLTLTDDMVLQEWLNKNISTSTFKDLMGSVATFRDKRYAAAAKIVRFQLGLPELPARNPTATQREAERQVSSIMEKLERIRIAPGLSDDFDPVDFVDKEIAKIKEEARKIAPEKLAEAKQKVAELAGKLKLPATTDIEDISDALADANNAKMTTDYARFINLVKNSQR